MAKLLSQSKNYEVELLINNKDYSSNIRMVRIISSLRTAYPSIQLFVDIEPDELILESLHGQHPIKLTIYLLEQEGQSKESIEFEIVTLTSNNDLPLLSNDATRKQFERTELIITGVCKKSFEVITTNVNEVFHKKEILTIANELANKAKATNTNFDNQKRNTQIIDQVVIPPMSLYKSLQYLNEMFGFYQGTPSIYCQYDGTLYIRNLTYRLTSSNPLFTLYHLHDLNDQEILKKSNDGKHFYSLSPIKTRYTGNSRTAVIANELKHIVKPSDDLYKIINNNIKDFARKYSLVYNKDELFIHSSLQNRKRYYIDHTGYEDDLSWIASTLGRNLSNLFFISSTLSNNLPVINFINVGETIVFEPQTTEYVSLSGNYILFSSEVILSRLNDWYAEATINLIRTNKVIH